MKHHHKGGVDDEASEKPLILYEFMLEYPEINMMHKR
jgi:hypothetical protein